MIRTFLLLSFFAFCSFDAFSQVPLTAPQSGESSAPENTYTTTLTSPPASHILAPQHFSIRIGSASAYAGQIVNIPVILSDVSGAAAQGVTDLTLIFHFSSTVLAPTNASQAGQVIVGIRRIFLALSVTASSDSVLITIPMIAALGETPTTILQIDSAITNTPNVILDKQNGLFSLLGICDQGGERLINPNGVATATLARNFSNGTALAATVTTCEDGITKLYLVDMVGRISKVFLNDAIATGDHLMQLDLSGVAAGKYMLVLETPTRRQTQAVEVTR